MVNGVHAAAIDEISTAATTAVVRPRMSTPPASGAPARAGRPLADRLRGTLTAGAVSVERSTETLVASTGAARTVDDSCS